MPPEAAMDFGATEISPELEARIARLNDRYRHHGATSVLEAALKDHDVGDLAMVSSFGAESVALLHLVSVIDNTVPVLFIDTQLLFTETLEYQQEVAERLNLKDMRIIRATDTRPGAPGPGRHAAPVQHRRLLRPAQDGPAGTGPFGLRRLDHRAQAVPVLDPRRPRFLRGRRRRPDQGEPAGPLAPRGRARLHGREPAAETPDGRQGLPIDRLLALHHTRQARRGPAGGPLARPGQG